LLRWFWWRINAWCEVVAMAASFTISTVFFILKLNGHPVAFAHTIFYGVGFTTVCWLLTACFSAPTSRERLIAFYKKVHPSGPGWTTIRKEAGISEAEAARHSDHMGMATAGWISGCLVVWSSLFAIGNFLYGRIQTAMLLSGVFIVSGIVLLYVINHLWSGGSNTSTKPPVPEALDSIKN
jgi:SSS family solute:Na+ symporter